MSYFIMTVVLIGAGWGCAELLRPGANLAYLGAALGLVAAVAMAVTHPGMP